MNDKGLVKRHVRIDTMTLSFIEWLSKKHGISSEGNINERVKELKEIGDSCLVTFIEGQSGFTYLIPVSGVLKTGMNTSGELVPNYELEDVKELFAGNLGELFEYDTNGVQSGEYGTSDREAYEIIGDFYKSESEFATFLFNHDEFMKQKTIKRGDFGKKTGNVITKSMGKETNEKRAKMIVDQINKKKLETECLERELRELMIGDDNNQSFVKDTNVQERTLINRDEMTGKSLRNETKFEVNYRGGQRKINLPKIFESDNDEKFIDIAGWFESVCFMLDLNGVFSRESRLAHVLSCVGDKHQSMIVRGLQLIREPTEKDVCKELLKIKNYNQIYLKQQVREFRIEPERQLLPQFEDLKSLLRAINLGIQEGPGREDAIELVCLREFEMKLPKTVTDEILYRLNCENKSPREIVRLAQRILDSLSV